MCDRLRWLSSVVSWLAGAAAAAAAAVMCTPAVGGRAPRCRRHSAMELMSSAGCVWAVCGPCVGVCSSRWQVQAACVSTAQCSPIIVLLAVCGWLQQQGQAA
jgi:homoaconitase/3-isopropylmalate dehydratase large subunit